MHMNLSTFLALRNPVLNFVNFLSSRALLSYKPISYKQVPWPRLCSLGMMEITTLQDGVVRGSFNR